MSVPVLHTFVVGEVATASNIDNNTVTLGNFLLNPPHAILRQTAAQNIPLTTFTALTFDAEDVDSDNGHSTSSNTSRYTGQTPGWFQCSGIYRAAANASGRRRTRWAVATAAVSASDLEIDVNGSTIEQAIAAITREVFLNGTTDYVELQVSQSAANPLATHVGTADQQSMMNVRWVSS
jgi:hypothetical protein